ncbi:MAG TPA: hypothetical protein VGM39_19320 [Kofleriaceae bacterium]|jgi:hypothetical protein
MRTSLLVTVPVVFGSALALAQPGADAPQPDPNAPPPAPMPAPAPMPGPAPAPAVQPVPQSAPVVGADPLKSGGFITGDRFDMNNRIGAEASYLVLDSKHDFTLLGFDVHGSYIDPVSHFGGYGSIPLAVVAGSDNDDENTFGYGDLQLGGLYAATISPTAGAIIRFGAILPTAPDDSLAKAQAIGIASARRLTDFALSFPKGKGFRASVSPMFRSGNLFGRFDIGLDEAWVDEGIGDDVRFTVFRINAGVGVDLVSAQLMAEFNLVNISADVDGSTSRSYESVGASARFPMGTLSPYAALVLPLNEEITDDISVAITAGLDAQL